MTLEIHCSQFGFSILCVFLKIITIYLKIICVSHLFQQHCWEIVCKEQNKLHIYNIINYAYLFSYKWLSFFFQPGILLTAELLYGKKEFGMEVNGTGERELCCWWFEQKSLRINLNLLQFISSYVFSLFVAFECVLNGRFHRSAFVIGRGWSLWPTFEAP